MWRRLNPRNSVPYTPFTPSSSSCTPYTSASIYTAAAQLAPSSTSTSSAPTSSVTSSPASESGSASATASSGSGAGSAAGPAATGGGQQNSQPGSGSGADDLKVAGILVAAVAGLVGVVAAF